MPPLPNQRQERFVRALVQGKSTSEAYEFAGYQYHTGNASRLRGNERVVARVRELAMPAAKRAQVTADSLLDELEEARVGAVQDRQWSAATAASMGKARITGKDIVRKEVGAPGEFESMRADELAAALVKLLAEHGLSVVEDDAGPAMIDVTPGEATE